MVAFPENVRQFIGEHIDSINLLETLLLLRRNAGRNWTAQAVCRELYTSQEASSRRLQQLAELRLLSQEPAALTYQYRPATKELQDLVDRLDEAYRVRRVTVINLIYSKPDSHAQAIEETRELDR